MKKFLSVACATIASLILVYVIVFTSLQIVINDQRFISNEYTELELNKAMGVSNSDLVRSFNQLSLYMQGRVDTIHLNVKINGVEQDMFSYEQEETHMRDVQTVYLMFKQYRDIGVLVLLVLYLLAAVIHFSRAPQNLAQGYLSGTFIALLLFGFLGTWAAMDFNSFWNAFHQALFWNDDWLFDPAKSRMINMLPEKMFSDIVSRLFLIAGIAVGSLVLLSILCLIFSSEGYRARKAEATAKKRQRLIEKRKEMKRKELQRREAEKAKLMEARKKRKAAVQAEREQVEQEARSAAEKAGIPTDPVDTHHEKTLNDAVAEDTIREKLSEDQKLELAAFEALRKRKERRAKREAARQKEEVPSGEPETAESEKSVRESSENENPEEAVEAAVWEEPSRRRNPRKARSLVPGVHPVIKKNVRRKLKDDTGFFDD